VKITIFGGTGETGLLVIKKGLEQGHSITAFTRVASNISIQHKALSIMESELTNTAQIEAAVNGAEAVISLLGPAGSRKGFTSADGISNIITAMRKQVVKRFIVIVAPGYKDANDKWQLGFFLHDLLLKVFFKAAYRNIAEIGKRVASSKLDWTLVRIPLLTDKAATGRIHIGYTGDGSIKLFSLTKEDLADFLLLQLTDMQYIGKAPVISN